MSTLNTNLTNGPFLVASGPQSVTISFTSGVGTWFVEDGATAVPPDEDVTGQYLGLHPVSFALEADQHLFVDPNGEAILVATATTLAFS